VNLRFLKAIGHLTVKGIFFVRFYKLIDCESTCASAILCMNITVLTKDRVQSRSDFSVIPSDMVCCFDRSHQHMRSRRPAFVSEETEETVLCSS
jgi:hypothetical protein